jgi:hypothetical protein
MEGYVTCPVPPVPADAPSSSDGASASLNDLVARLGQLIQALDKQNQMLLCMVDMNQQILEELLGKDDAAEPMRDLSGRPLKLG